MAKKRPIALSSVLTERALDALAALAIDWAQRNATVGAGETTPPRPSKSDVRTGARGRLRGPRSRGRRAA